MRQKVKSRLVCRYLYNKRENCSLAPPCLVDGLSQMVAYFVPTCHQMRHSQKEGPDGVCDDWGHFPLLLQCHPDPGVSFPLFGELSCFSLGSWLEVRQFSELSTSRLKFHCLVSSGVPNMQMPTRGGPW